MRDRAVYGIFSHLILLPSSGYRISFSKGFVRFLRMLRLPICVICETTGLFGGTCIQNTCLTQTPMLQYLTHLSSAMVLCCESPCTAAPVRPPMNTIFPWQSLSICSKKFLFVSPSTNVHTVTDLERPGWVDHHMVDPCRDPPIFGQWLATVDRLGMRRRLCGEPTEVSRLSLKAFWTQKKALPSTSTCRAPQSERFLPAAWISLPLP